MPKKKRAIEGVVGDDFYEKVTTISIINTNNTNNLCNNGDEDEEKNEFMIKKNHHQLGKKKAVDEIYVINDNNNNHNTITTTEYEIKILTSENLFNQEGSLTGQEAEDLDNTHDFTYNENEKLESASENTTNSTATIADRTNNIQNETLTLEVQNDKDDDHDEMNRKETTKETTKEKISNSNHNNNNSNKIPKTLITCLNDLKYNGNLVSWKITAHGEHLSVKITWNNNEQKNKSEPLLKESLNYFLKLGPTVSTSNQGKSNNNNVGDQSYYGQLYDEVLTKENLFKLIDSDLNMFRSKFKNCVKVLINELNTHEVQNNRNNREYI